jgi:hypothetical protein
MLNVESNAAPAADVTPATSLLRRPSALASPKLSKPPMPSGSRPWVDASKP